MRTRSVIMVLVLFVSSCAGGDSAEIPTSEVTVSLTFVPSTTATTSSTSAATTQPVERELRVASLTVNGTQLTAADGMYTVTDPVNPGDRLDIEATINTADETVTRSIPVSGDLREPELSVLLDDGLTAVLRFEPGDGWEPIITLADPTGHTGEVTIEVTVFDLNGAETIESLSVAQEFNFQHPDHADGVIAEAGQEPSSVESLTEGATAVSFDDSRFDFVYTADKEITEYVSTNPLSPIVVTRTAAGMFEISFSSEWPGRFPIHLTVVDADGNNTQARVPVYVYPKEPPFPVQGAAISPYWDVNFDYSPILDHLSAQGVEFIEINPIWFMPSPTATEIRPWPEQWEPGAGGLTMSDTSLRRLVNAAQERGMDVFLKPMLEFDNWTGWRGDLSPTNWNRWFRSYTEFIVHYATLGEEEDVTLIAVGSELRNAAKHEALWREVISDVRDVFSGELTYSDSEALPGNSEVRFWDALDLIGIPFYYPSNGSFWQSDPTRTNPTIGEMRVSLDRNFSQYVLPVAKEFELEVLVTEIGVPDYDGASVFPWIWEQPEGVLSDLQEQADYYEAALRVLQGRVRGVFWWQTVFTADHALGEGQAQYDPYGNPADDVMGIWFSDE